VDVRSTAVAANPLVRTDDAFGFVSGTTISPIAGLSDALMQISATDIEVNADRTAAAVRDVSGAVLEVPADGPIRRLDTRPDLVAPPSIPRDTSGRCRRTRPDR
jgi:hypothetical protein